jgi:hypothetical protein
MAFPLSWLGDCSSLPYDAPLREPGGHHPIRTTLFRAMVLLEVRHGWWCQWCTRWISINDTMVSFRHTMRLYAEAISAVRNTALR